MINKHRGIGRWQTQKEKYATWKALMVNLACAASDLDGIIQPRYITAIYSVIDEWQDSTILCISDQAAEIDQYEADANAG